MEKLIELASNVRLLRGALIALASALLTFTGVTVTGNGTAAALEGHEQIQVDIGKVEADVASLQQWRDSASAVLTSLMCGEIARNLGKDSRPCEMLCPPHVRRNIRELLDNGGQP
jgi:hypothetical protein